MLVGYSKGDAAMFNSELAKYQTWLVGAQARRISTPAKVGYEAFFNFFEPFYCALVLYVVAFVLVALGWLGWTRPLESRGVLADRLHARAAHLRAGFAHLYFRPAAGDQPLFRRRVHRLGRRGAGA